MPMSSRPGGSYASRHRSKVACLIMLSGLPGTGKSTLAKKLGQNLDVVIVESDAIRNEMVDMPTFSGKENNRVFETVYKMMRQHLDVGHTVVMDATNLIEGYRDVAYRIAEHYAVPLILVSVEAEARVVRERLERRAESESNVFVAGWSVYRRMSITQEPISRGHIRVDTTDGVDEGAAQIIIAVHDALKSEEASS